MAELAQNIPAFILSLWWFWLFLFLVPLFESSWLAWRQKHFEHGMEWTILEIVIPREVSKSPQAMEQVLMSLHALRNVATNFEESYKDGEITRWFCLEMVSFGGEIHFYIRFYHKYRPLVEAAFFSYYPDLELVQVDDYITRFPANMQECYRQGYDLWGTELYTTKPAAYPIKTYRDFESPDESKQFDPISTFLEVLSKVKNEELVGIQILIAPAEDHWYEEFEGVIQKIKENKSQKKNKEKVTTFVNFPGGPLPHFESRSHKEEETKSTYVMRTPGETNILEAVENNLSKKAFETIIRFVYLSPKSIFYDSFPRRGLAGAFNQYAAADLNSFVQNHPIATRTLIWNPPYIFPNWRNEYKKQRMLYNYRGREMGSDTFIGKLIDSYFFDWNFKTKKFLMTTQCLATLFHPPTLGVLTAPHMKRAEHRKAGPPSGLAIFGAEDDLEKFQ
ncbi:MAG: hypothetical protein AAB903_01545 [Patescibacteria group bacterium]